MENESSAGGGGDGRDDIIYQSHGRGRGGQGDAEAEENKAKRRFTAASSLLIRVSVITEQRKITENQLKLNRARNCHCGQNFHLNVTTEVARTLQAWNIEKFTQQKSITDQTKKRMYQTASSRVRPKHQTGSESDRNIFLFR